VWLPEIGLAIGYENRDYANWSREWLFWYDQSGARYLTEREKIAVAESATIAMWQAKEQERQAKERERLAKEKLANYLRAMGINPEDI
jgi:hypothetical protein